MAAKSVSPWAVPLAIALGVPIGLTVGREFGGDDRGARLLYGGIAGVIAALVVMGVFALMARRQPNDV